MQEIDLVDKTEAAWADIFSLLVSSIDQGPKTLHFPLCNSKHPKFVTKAFCLKCVQTFVSDFGESHWLRITVCDE